VISILRRGLALLLCCALVAPSVAHAQGQSVSFIRDAEIEALIRRYATPVFNAAGLDAEAVRIYLVNDARLNAFVAGGQNLFLNTGLLARAESPNQVIGVIAHETGHISGGHLARTQEAMRNATAQMIIAMVLGAAAAAAGGGGNAAGGVIAGGAGVGQRSFLAYSVAQESAADQAGLGFLERTGQSAQGIADFLRILAEQDLLSPQRQDPYLRTHPLTRSRIESVEAFLQRSKHADAKDPPELVEAHRRMQAKLHGFIDPPGRTFGAYKESDPSVAARYARAIAYYRVPDLPKALALVDGLIAQEPENPWFHELKGQILFENGRVREALPSYERALSLKPEVALLRVELARVQLETNDPALNKTALAYLKEAVRREDRNSTAWRLLAVAYGRENEIGMSALSLAEGAMVTGDRRMALQQATRAVQLLPAGTPGRLRAEDLKEAAKRLEDER
jgi:predicted Zn-dependent protease